MTAPLKRLFLAAIVALAPLSALHAQDDDEGVRKDAYKDLARAGKLITAGKLKHAERILKALVVDIPKSPSAWYQLALVLSLQNKDKDSLAAVEKTLELRKDDLNALLLATAVLTDRWNVAP